MPESESCKLLIGGSYNTTTAEAGLSSRKMGVDTGRLRSYNRNIPNHICCGAPSRTESLGPVEAEGVLCMGETCKRHEGSNGANRACDYRR